jgi:hypothetical protein
VPGATCAFGFDYARHGTPGRGAHYWLVGTTCARLHLLRADTLEPVPAAGTSKVPLVLDVSFAREGEPAAAVTAIATPNGGKAFDPFEHDKERKKREAAAEAEGRAVDDEGEADAQALLAVGYADGSLRQFRLGDLMSAAEL